MRVAIIGFGGIGRGYAAYLTAQGHEPVIWSPSGAALADFAEDASLTVTGTALPPKARISVAKKGLPPVIW